MPESLGKQLIKVLNHDCGRHPRTSSVIAIIDSLLQSLEIKEPDPYACADIYVRFWAYGEMFTAREVNHKIATIRAELKNG